MDKKWQKLFFYPIFVKEWNFVKIPILTGASGWNATGVKILSNYFKIARFYSRKTIFAISQMSRRVADIYERVQIFSGPIVESKPFSDLLLTVLDK